MNATEVVVVFPETSMAFLTTPAEGQAFLKKFAVFVEVRPAGLPLLVVKDNIVIDCMTAIGAYLREPKPLPGEMMAQSVQEMVATMKKVTKEGNEWKGG